MPLRRHVLHSMPRLPLLAKMVCTFSLSLFFIPSTCLFAQRVDVNCANNKTDAERLNSAISNSRSGDQIQIHGVCLVDSTIVLMGNRTYVGDSRTGTIIRQAPGANLRALLASDSWSADTAYTGAPIRIAHLTLDGNSSANTGTNVLVIRSWLSVIEDILIENAPNDGLQITNLSKNETALDTSQVNGHISNCFITNSGGNGIHVVDTGNAVTDWNLLDSWVAYSGKSAIYLENAAGWKIHGNHVYGVGEHAIYANACFATAIDENYIEDFGDSGGSHTWYGIACTVQGGASSIISENKIFMLNGEPSASTFVYIGVPQVNYGVGQLNVVNNSIRGAGGKGDIGLDYQLNGGSGLNLLSSNNVVESVHTERSVGEGVKLVTTF
jgi:hypothetical protein